MNVDYKYDGYDEQQNALPPQRNFFIRSYCSEQSIFRVFSEEYGSMIKHAHIITHNQDNIKGKHCHICLVTVGPTSLKAIHGWFRLCQDDEGNYGNTFVEIMKNPVLAYQYLIHANDKNKEPYDPMSIKHIGSARSCMNAIEEIPEYNRTIRAWKEFDNGAPTAYLVEKYGRDFLFHITQFEKAKRRVGEFDHIEDLVKSLKSDLSACNQICSELLNFRSVYLTYDSETYLSPKATDSLYNIIEQFIKIFDYVEV